MKDVAGQKRIAPGLNEICGCSQIFPVLQYCAVFDSTVAQITS